MPSPHIFPLLRSWQITLISTKSLWGLSLSRGNAVNCSSLWVIPPSIGHLHYRLCPRRGLNPPNQTTPGFVTSCSNIKTCPGSSVFLTAWFRRISQEQFSIQWVIYITYYRFLWSQLGNLPGHCSLFPTTSILHKEESFQANSVPLAALFLPHHPSCSLYPDLQQSISASPRYGRCCIFFSLLTLPKVQLEEGWASWKVHTWNSNLSHTLVVCANASAVETH